MINDKLPFEDRLPYGIGVPGAGTVLVHVDPAGDPRVHALGLEVIELVQRAEARMVASDADVRVATEDLAVIQGLTEAFEAKRKEFTGPLNGYLKDINASFKDFTGPLNEADRVNRAKIVVYQQEQRRIRAEQERINQLREEAARAEMELKGELTAPVNLVEVAPEPPAHYRTLAGDLGTATIRKWEVEDINQVPREYLVIDAARVGKVVRAGIPSIPGIRIYTEEALRVTRAR